MMVVVQEAIKGIAGKCKLDICDDKILLDTIQLQTQTPGKNQPPSGVL